jgi:hypothetical protein
MKMLLEKFDDLLVTHTRQIKPEELENVSDNDATDITDSNLCSPEPSNADDDAGMVVDFSCDVKVRASCAKTPNLAKVLLSGCSKWKC